MRKEKGLKKWVEGLKKWFCALTAAAVLSQNGCGQIAVAAEVEDGCMALTSMQAAVFREQTPPNAEKEHTPSNAEPELLEFALAQLNAAAGDLWEEWNGDMEFPGDGTETAPYQISTLSQLMGFSEAVASGISFEEAYLELTEDIDLGNIDVNGGNWNPIGWYQNSTELGGKVRTPFRGHFDGAGHTISGLKIVNLAKPVCYVGLFGVIDGGTVRNLQVEAGDIYGEGMAGVLAGAVTGDAVIYDVTVSGYVSSKGDTGGIAGMVMGGVDYAVIENCVADGIVLNGRGSGCFTGGIAGNVQRANLVDNTVITQDGDANRIRGLGYVGGIAGRMNLTNLYDSYVSGTIGGNGSMAAGGIVGKYESGNLVLARFCGDISRTNNGNASHEGTFVGTRGGRNQFTYGTQKHNHLSYLYTTSGAMAKRVFGSNIDGDNIYTKDAHIGYWSDYEKKYVTVAGTVEAGCGDRYFYEELEDGVRYIVTQKLDREFTSTGYFEGLAFRMDHYAPGYMGEPVRGHLVSVPRIDTKNANGTYDTDVAVLTALPAANGLYYRTIDKDHAAAVADGAVLNVLTSPKNNGGGRYQMAMDVNELGGVRPPTFIDEAGDEVEMNYVNGGSYTFTMPECDTTLSAEYVKVTTELAITPADTVISIIQTRNGDRKNPGITTEVKNAQGILIARYIDGVQDTAVQVQPVAIHAEHNGAGQTADRSVKWSVDDRNLIINGSETGFTEKDAMIMPNLDSSFIQEIINREVQAQADNQYREKINNTVYSRNAVVTAVTNPATTVNNQTVYGNCRVNVTFQIVDNTTVRVEGLNLNKTGISYTITRRLTGDRLSPDESYSCPEPTELTATLHPEQPFFKNVGWKDQEAGKIITLMPSGDHTQDCRVAVNFGKEETDYPAWIQNIIHDDNDKKSADPYTKLDGTGICTETVTATSEDQTHGHMTTECDVTIRFVTVDETVIHPEKVQMSRDKMVLDLNVTKVGGAQSLDAESSGFVPTDLGCTVLPFLDDDIHKPYNRAVTWSVSDPDALSIDQNGTVTPNQNAQWIKDALKEAPYTASKTVIVSAAAEDNHVAGQTEVVLNYTTRCLELKKKTMIWDLVLKKTGRRASPMLTWEGGEAKNAAADTYQTVRPVRYESSVPGVVTVDDDGTIVPVLDAGLEWMKPAMNYPYKAETAVTVSATDGTSKETCEITLHISVNDTTSSGSGGNSTGGGGGSSRGVTASGFTASSARVPDYVKTGTWFQNAAGKWMFTDSTRTYANEWAAIHNPYAKVEAGQSVYDWFRFDKEGYLMTGWFEDADGNDYYLNPASDGTQGRVLTGWNWLGETCYYFSNMSDGTRGALKRNYSTADGDQTNQEGVWTVDGVVQVRKEP